MRHLEGHRCEPVPGPGFLEEFLELFRQLDASLFCFFLQPCQLLCRPLEAFRALWELRWELKVVNSVCVSVLLVVVFVVLHYKHLHHTGLWLLQVKVRLEHLCFQHACDCSLIVPPPEPALDSKVGCRCHSSYVHS